MTFCIRIDLGSGISGCSIAHFLSRAGKRVAIVERTRLGNGARLEKKAWLFVCKFILWTSQNIYCFQWCCRSFCQSSCWFPNCVEYLHQSKFSLHSQLLSISCIQSHHSSGSHQNETFSNLLGWFLAVWKVRKLHFFLSVCVLQTRTSHLTLELLMTIFTFVLFCF